MKIVFMGTPDFAIPSLKKLLESRHEVVAVVTTPDKERGRGQKVTFTAVKQFALDNNLPVLQPQKLKDETFISELKKLNAQLYVVVAFRILPREVFTLPENGAFNLHGSLLPKFRGAAPIQWAIISGETETGVTTFALEDKVDTGNVYIQEKIPLLDSDDFGSLHDKLSVLGADVVMRTVELIDSGNYSLLPQNNEFASAAPKITKEITEINWQKDARSIHNLIRGLSPYPGAYFTFKDKIIKVFKSRIINTGTMSPGEIKFDKKTLSVGCGSMALEILELQLEGKKRLGVEEFLRGFNFN